jgi:hypothetical protein
MRFQNCGTPAKKEKKSMSCVPCGKSDNMPWLSLYRRCYAALEASGIKDVKVYWLMAICIMESGGNGYWMPGNSDLQKNLAAMYDITKIPVDRFRGMIMVKTANNRGYVPKFRTEPTWWHQLSNNKDFQSLDAYTLAVIASSWGIAQKGGLYLNQGIPALLQYQKLAEFMYNEPEQLRVLVDDVHHLIGLDPDAVPLMYTRYNGGASQNKVSKYGVAAASIGNGFLGNLAQRGLKLCLD